MIKDMIKEERPRERLIKYGVKSLSTEELIAIIIRTGTKGKSVKELSRDILNLFESIEDLKNLDINMLTNIKGIGNVKAIELISALELGKEYIKIVMFQKKITKGLDIYDVFKHIIRDNNQEQFYDVSDIKEYIGH